MSSCRVKRGLSRVCSGFSWLIWLCSPLVFAADFSGPLQDVQVSVSPSGVTYQVFDPGPGVFVQSNTTTAGTISYVTTNGGVVSWLAGSTVYFQIYDPGRSRWMGGNATTAGYIPPIASDSGLVVWVAGTDVYFAVYDPVLGGWKANGMHIGAAVSGLVNGGGVAAWYANPNVYYLTYDPILHNWAWQAVLMGSFVGDLQASGGVAAWQISTAAYYVVYDVSRTSWIGGTWGPAGAFITNLRIDNSTVSWISPSPGIGYKAGYTSATGTWTTGISTPAHAAFLVSTNTGNPPLFVWFTDLSLGGSSWSWNFGDGGTATGRTPYHVFDGLGRYQVVQTVGASTASTNILTDLSPPSGSMLINNGDGYTRSTSVTLTLAVTDNSGVVAAMRFSNTNGVNWSSWVPYATNYPWTLTSGDGIKSVYGQFMDPSSNLSLTLFDSITLDSGPPPVAFTTNYVVSESTPSLQVTVLLSASTHFPVGVDYATSDGTATAGLDYGSASGRLTFLPGQTNRSFTLYITNDTLVELNETILINLSNPTNATVGPPGIVTIQDDDPPTVSFANNAFVANQDALNAVITVSLNAASGMTNTINYATSNGTATAGIDYYSVSGTLTFLPGQTSSTFRIPLINETYNEPSETVLLYLSHPTNALLGALSNATLTILDVNPPRASLDTNSFQVNETDGSVAVTVRLSNPSLQTVYVGYATSDGSAKAGRDYVAAGGTLIFAPGETNKSFPITLLPDAFQQDSETVLISLSNLINATPGAFLTGTLTILQGPRLVSSSWQTNTGFHCTLSGPPGHVYAIDAVGTLTNAPQWLEITRVTNATGTVSFTDPAAGTMNRRFYRARQTN